MTLYFILQLMVGIHSGHRGGHVQSRVEVDHKTEADHVQVQHHNMAALNALEPVHKLKVATPTTVQVWHLFIKIFLMLFFKTFSLQKRYPHVHIKYSTLSFVLKKLSS